MREQRIVIFGGPDRCGKTSIAKALSARWEIPYFKPVNQQWLAKNDPRVFMQQTMWAEPKLLDFLKQTKVSVIMDRGFPCDWAYSKAFNRETAWEMIETLDIGYSELNTLLVITTRKSFAGRVDDSWKAVDESMLVKLDSLYRNYAENSRMKSLVLETDDEDLEDQIKQITEAFIRQETK